jgi:hypothetical protein
MTEPYPDEMFEEAARREAENKALAALGIDYGTSKVKMM